jgi:hypothetical protein
VVFASPGPYTPEFVTNLQNYSATLSEKDRRRFAAVEARRLGHGGIEYVACVLGCSRRTIERGLHELDRLPVDPAAGRVRRLGGGRKKRLTRTRNSKPT